MPRQDREGAEVGRGDPVEAAREFCLRQLSVGPRSAAQLSAALARRGVDGQVAAEAVRRLAAVGLVDDAAFAAAWVETRHAGRGLARGALARELRGRGVADPDVTTALGTLAPDRELAAARSLVAGRLGATRGLDSIARCRRIAALLTRKGYPPGLTYRVIREGLEAEALAAEPECGPLDDELLAGVLAAVEAAEAVDHD